MASCRRAGRVVAGGRYKSIPCRARAMRASSFAVKSMGAKRVKRGVVFDGCCDDCRWRLSVWTGVGHASFRATMQTSIREAARGQDAEIGQVINIVREAARRAGGRDAEIGQTINIAFENCLARRALGGAGSEIGKIGQTINIQNWTDY